ncbi:hypothetical protein [Actinoplanes sp. NPDC023714]|uniref:hypothetical protein n=1 Tax=Actinoplanes sp. NPDC023714 TaxID=3154322 RepID=UPI0034075E63
MDDQRSAPSRGAALVRAWGGTPGWFTVASLLLALVWFPFRLFLDGGDPLALVVARAALYGVIWALMIPVFAWLNGRRKPRPASLVDRRGALVGLGVGVPYYGGLILLCLITGRSWVYTISFGLVLAAIVTLAVRGLRKPSEP